MRKEMIKIENLSKRYRLGTIGTGTLSHDLNAWWRRNVQKRADDLPGRSDNLRPGNGREHVWPLKDINFSVREGEVFGVIGKNGAGKSTLLKIMSRITKPTTGTIKLGGRVASLLEVGTGFHPELTGRENVFLNGAILGMTKAEIIRKFDEIVDFSGVKKYIDTPVKRYSSGMYVRLAFAVSAHLEPEILIVDEVLSVGDAEFQQKCLGKMQQVSSGEGRTVLFVSHNISAIKQLCTRAVLLENGRQKSLGPVNEVLDLYQAKPTDLIAGWRAPIPQDVAAYFTDWMLEGVDKHHAHVCTSRDYCTFSFGFVAKEHLSTCEVRIALRYEDDSIVVYASSLDTGGAKISVGRGTYRLRFALALPIRQGNYQVEVGIWSFGKVVDTWASGTPLVVLDNFALHVPGAMLNIETIFSAERTEVEANTIDN